MRRWLTLIALVPLIAGASVAGDIATFENLGFNESAEVFVFGQYGVTGDQSSPFAEIYFVDVAGNRFLSGGSLDYSSAEPLSLGQDGRGALYALLRQADALFEREAVEHLVTGRPVYVLVDGDEPRERLTFRDFNAETRYDVRLVQEQRGADENVSTAFRIELSVTHADDRVVTRTIGRPSLFREGVASYRITQIVVGPDEASVVFVLEKRSPDGTIRYMVETAAL
jgi:predicted secreted protein